jgi:hypothetical protein
MSKLDEELRKMKRTVWWSTAAFVAWVLVVTALALLLI